MFNIRKLFSGKPAHAPRTSSRPRVTKTDTDAAAAVASAMEVKRQLGLVLRDTLLHAGMLSSEYGYKVLVTYGDSAKNVLVVNLQRPLPGGLEKQAAAERLLVLLARAKGLRVGAVYWRVSSMVGAATASQLSLADAAAAVREVPLRGSREDELLASNPSLRDGFADTVAATPRRPADSDLMPLLP